MKLGQGYEWVDNNEDDISRYIHILPRYENGKLYIRIQVGTENDGLVFDKFINQSYLMNLIAKLVELSMLIIKDNDGRNGN